MEELTNLKAAGQQIRDLRRTLDVSANELAIASGVNRTTVTAIERGGHRTREETLRAVVVALSAVPDPMDTCAAGWHRAA